ncbi:TonB-dependent receptor [Castellaniella sp.]|uniref:TonB-dependent receptor n=1 Tax=Castellaniella sp. TaxID=1955812 RepID=UPI003560C1D5
MLTRETKKSSCPGRIGRHTLAGTLALVGGLLPAQNVGAADHVGTLSPIVVTATRSATAANETPGASYALTAENLEKRNIKSLDDALRFVPGVFVQRGKGLMDTRSEIIMRGVPGGKRSLVLIDGLPLNDAYDNSARLGGFAPEDLERVEVALGPGSSLYGSSAMGGVVHFITRMPQTEEYRFRVGYGSGLRSDRGLANLRRSYVSLGNAWESGLSMIASVSATATHGYASDLVTTALRPPAGIDGAEPSRTVSGSNNFIVGDRGRNAWHDQEVSLRGQFKVNPATTLSARFFRTVYRYEYDDHQTYLRDSSGNSVWSYQADSGAWLSEAAFLPGQGRYERNLYSLGMETRLGDSDLKLQGGLVDSRTNWYTSVSASSTTASLEGGGAANGYSQTPSRVALFDATVTTPLMDRHLLVWGASWRHERADTSEYDLADWRDPGSRTARVADSGGKATTIGLFAQLELELAEGVHAYLGARYDRWRSYSGYASNYASDGFAQTYANKAVGSVSPSLGLVWVVNPALTLRTSVGKAFRAPGIYDLYRTWKSSTTVYAGGPQLTPETMKGFELGGDFRPWKGAEFKLTYFRNDFDNMIYRRTVTADAERLSVCGTTTLACQVWGNVARAFSQGIEVAASQDIDAHWRTFANFTYNDTRIKENPANPALVGKRLTQIPRVMTSFGIDWERGDWSASGNLRYVSKRYNTDMNTDVVNGVPGSYDPYTLVDLKASYRIGRHLSASLSVDNVFNRKYFSSYLAPGRSWFFELSGQF